MHYHFVPRKDVPDDRLFTSVYGDIRVEGDRRQRRAREHDDDDHAEEG